MYACKGSIMRKWKLLPSIPGCGFIYTSLHGGHQKFQGEGVQEEAISKGVGLDSQGLFSRDFKTRIIVLIDDLTLTVISECCFTVYLYDILVFMYLI